MVKQPPITAVNQSGGKAASRKRVSKKKTPSSEKKTSSGKKSFRKQRGKKRGEHTWSVPGWVYYIMLGVTAALVLIVFYYLFIQPYAYRWKPCYGMKAYGVCLPYGFGVHGFDISHHQGQIDWSELQKLQDSPFPVRFVFMKASEGGYFSDTAFVRNFDAARRYGFIRGAYHFYNPKTDALRQADFFIRSVKLEPGDLPPVLDIEVRGDDDRKLRNDLQIWLRRIEQYYKVKPILYTSYKFKTRYLNDSLFNAYPYWIAHYYVDSVEYRGKWQFWQHTDMGKLPGIRERVDLNVFNGSWEELLKLAIPYPDSLASVSSGAGNRRLKVENH